jgi:hypothetical protein
MAPDRSAKCSVPQTRVRETFNPVRRFIGIFIPESLVRYPHLSPSAKLAYGRLLRYAGEGGRCFPAVNTLAKEIDLRALQTLSSLAELAGTHERLIEREFSERPVRGGYRLTEAGRRAIATEQVGGAR